MYSVNISVLLSSEGPGKYYLMAVISYIEAFYCTVLSCYVTVALQGPRKYYWWLFAAVSICSI